MSCIFCRIANGEVPTEHLYEDGDVIAFPDAYPITPVHILIIPKRHIASMNDVEESDSALVGKMLYVAKEIAKKKTFASTSGKKMNLSEAGYKLLLRTGEHGGQEIKHIHLHLLGGGKMHEDIHV